MTIKIQHAFSMESFLLRRQRLAGAAAVIFDEIELLSSQGRLSDELQKKYLDIVEKFRQKVREYPESVFPKSVLILAELTHEFTGKNECAVRGRDVLRGAKDGHVAIHGSPEMKAKRWNALNAEFAKIKRRNPALSDNAVCEIMGRTRAGKNPAAAIKKMLQRHPAKRK